MPSRAISCSVYCTYVVVVSHPTVSHGASRVVSICTITYPVKHVLHVYRRALSVHRRKHTGRHASNVLAPRRARAVGRRVSCQVGREVCVIRRTVQVLLLSILLQPAVARSSSSVLPAFPTHSVDDAACAHLGRGRAMVGEGTIIYNNARTPQYSSHRVSSICLGEASNHPRRKRVPDSPL